MISHWAKTCLTEGESGILLKMQPWNKFTALHTSKKLSELEYLRLIVVKLEIENERLK